MFLAQFPAKGKKQRPSCIVSLPAPPTFALPPTPLQHSEKQIMNQRMQGKRVLVTGAGTGIGRGVALEFAAEGAQVALHYSHSEHGAQEAVATIRAAGGTAAAFRADFSQMEDVGRLAEESMGFLGGLDILVNNAGILATETTQNIETTTLAQWRTVQQVNVEGVFMGCRMAVGMMKGAGGSIINISSTAGIVGTPVLVAYGASKGAVRMLTKGVAPVSYTHLTLPTNREV